MKRWMYISSAADKDLFRRLRDNGVTGVIGSCALAEAAGEAGLEVMLCGGAFPAQLCPGDQHLAVDIRGKKRLWFGSCCPNHPETREQNLAAYRRMLDTPRIAGVLIDGARFASPASSTAPESFFTCFCPNCRRKMETFGLDPQRIAAAVSDLYAFLLEGGPPPQDREGLLQWMTFRRLSVEEHLRDFVRVIRSVPGVAAGAFVFAPSLSKMVGQCYRTLAEELDLLAPMLYPAWPLTPTDPGPACLNGELTALLRLMTAGGALSEPEALACLSERMAADLPDAAALSAQLPASLVGSETARAIREGKAAAILPTLQLGDPLLAESIRAAHQAGAADLAFFAYAPQHDASLKLLSL